MYVTDLWLHNIDKALVTGVTFVDLNKAFDTVDVNILLAKLTSVGIAGNELQWFQNYLTGITVDNHFADPSSVNMGVPRGSILCPLVFFNDFPSITETSETNMFADDT